MTPLLAFALRVAMLIASPSHPDAEPPPNVRAVVVDVVQAVEGARSLPFDGPRAHEATIVVMLEIADRESTFRPEVRSCEVAGDAGQAFTTWQLHRLPEAARKRLCADPRAAARVALGRLVEARKRPRWGGARGLIASYLGAHGREARRRLAEVERIAVAEGIDLSGDMAGWL